MGPGPLIAIDVILLYTLLGPLVLFAVYVAFDFLSQTGGKQPDETTQKKDPALWTGVDISDYFSRN